jgi:hypothetical protein
MVLWFDGYTGYLKSKSVKSALGNELLGFDGASVGLGRPGYRERLLRYNAALEPRGPSSDPLTSTRLQHCTIKPSDDAAALPGR